MKFIDEVSLHAVAGRGGLGVVSFRRERNKPFGGPDGGNGGNGGSVWLEADSGLNTLVDYLVKPLHRAAGGEHGQGSDRHGKAAEDLVLKVPLGTRVFERETEQLLGDLTAVGQRLCVARGGRGGLGNLHFRSNRHKAPRHSLPPDEGEDVWLRLELMLLADVGLLGWPNAGKSSLVAAWSAARPKVADYPFTTLAPSLGVVRLAEGESFVLADIPGLIAGAAEGRGLGHQFLRHLKRTAVIVQLLSVEDEPEQAWHKRQALVHELACFDAELAAKPRLLVLSKADLLDQSQRQQWEQSFGQLAEGERWLWLSSVSGEGLRQLGHSLMPLLKAGDE